MFKDIVNELRQNFPSSYGGSNRMCWLNQLLITNGNGYSWTSTGHTLEYAGGDKLRRDKPKHTAAELHAMGMERLRTMPDFVPVTEHRSYGTRGLGGFRRALANADQEAALAEWDLDHGTKAGAYEAMTKEISHSVESGGRYDMEFYLKSLAEPQSFYTVSLERYSAVADMAEGAEPDIIRAGFDVLFHGVLTQRQGSAHHQAHNQLHALILLLKKKELFRSADMWPGDAEVIGHTEWCGSQYLNLSMKEHISNHAIDERRLTNSEFEWYHGLCFDGFSEEEIELIRKYSFYLRWEKERAQEMREESSTRDHCRKRAFWVELSAVPQVEGDRTIAYQIPEQTIADAEAVGHIAVNRCIFSRKTGI